MSKPTGKEVAALAEALADGKRIPYVYGHETLTSADCQGFIEAVVRKLGGEMSYRGSNDMFRNAVSFVIPIDQARKNNLFRPGGLLFILKKDGGEVARGYNDGMGNASHVGLYTGGKYFSVHSSSAADDVVGTTDSYPWTHYGESKAIDHQEIDRPVDPNPPIPANDLSNVIKALEAALAGLKKYAAGS